MTLTGPGGIGKTRLALELARALVREYPDGVWLIQLGPITDSARVVQAVAAALGVAQEASLPLVETLQRSLLGQCQLLLLDNCEHVLDATASLVRRLLTANPELRIITTSREPLGVPGETLWRVQPLGLRTPEPSSVPCPTEHSDAVRLFVDRARSVQPEFTLSDVNVGIIDRICQRVDGIPLAIELAAAAITFVTPQQLLDRLDDRTQFLDRMGRIGSRRHQTMSAAIERSYELLTDSERRLFCALAVFVGGFELDAAESVCVAADLLPDDIIGLLRNLVSKSLVTANATPAGTMRYRLLEPLREFALERLEECASATVMRNAHAQFYVDMSCASNLVQAQGAGGRYWPILTREHDNLYAAFLWLLSRNEAVAAQIVATAVCEVWRIRGQIGEARALLARVMTLGDHSGSAMAHASEMARAGLLLLAGQLAYFQGDFTSALALLEQSISLSRQAGFPPGLARGLIRLADIDRAKGDYAAARGRIVEASAACSHLDRGTGLWESVQLRGSMIDLDQQHYASARAKVEALLPIVRRGGYLRVEAEALIALAGCCSMEGRHAEAAMHLEDSLKIWEASDRWGSVRAQIELARVAVVTNDVDRARSLIESSLDVGRQLGDPWAIASALDVGAALAGRRGRLAHAVQLREAAAVVRDNAQIVQSAREQAWLDNQLTFVHRQLGGVRYTAARQAGQAMTLGQAFELAHRRDDARASSGMLTRREQQVVQLLATARSNREIADQLVIALPTVERHVANILTKLQLRSRAEVAIWALAQSAPAARD